MLFNTAQINSCRVFPVAINIAPNVYAVYTGNFISPGISLFDFGIFSIQVVPVIENGPENQSWITGPGNVFTAGIINPISSDVSYDVEAVNIDGYGGLNYFSYYSGFPLVQIPINIGCSYPVVGTQTVSLKINISGVTSVVGTVRTQIAITSPATATANPIITSPGDQVVSVGGNPTILIGTFSAQDFTQWYERISWGDGSSDYDSSTYYDSHGNHNGIFVPNDPYVSEVRGISKSYASLGIYNVTQTVSNVQNPDTFSSIIFKVTVL